MQGKLGAHRMVQSACLRIILHLDSSAMDVDWNTYPKVLNENCS
jgi:hypothetical protein